MANSDGDIRVGRSAVVGDLQPLHYAATEDNKELNKSLKVIALLIFGPNMTILFSLDWSYYLKN